MNSTYSIPTVPVRRGNWEGLLQILRFNYPMFMAAGTVVAAGAAALEFLSLPRMLEWIIAVTIGMGLCWCAATLAVSHLVYDCHPTFKFHWLRQYLSGTAWANVHAGFDQTSLMLCQNFPAMLGTPIDLFDKQIMTERSIHRARKYYLVVPGTLSGTWNALPLPDASVNAVLMLFAAHELRLPSQLAALFREARRILKPGGTLVVAEHLRSISNGLAFGPGVFHFHSRRQWTHAGDAAGLCLEQEIPLTPFAQSFIWRKQK